MMTNAADALARPPANDALARPPAKKTFVRDHALGPFHLVETADGSLTAQFGEAETMHSLRGAFNETVYIYGTALDRARGTVKSPRTLSLGLGVGYVEILSAAYALKAGETPRGESFELVDDLTESFRAWLSGVPEVLVPHSLYEDVTRRTSELTGVPANAIRTALAKAVEIQDWSLRPAMSPTTTFPMKFQCVAFDAFSSKSTPELWTREFLDHFMKVACDTPCVLSTYACTGHLKRALVEAGFNLEIREGYSSKRDSTLATR
ncbi:hypothetical protein BH10BDE1_BH10BDE1_25350 [soil metagenome]